MNHAGVRDVFGIVVDDGDGDGYDGDDGDTGVRPHENDQSAGLDSRE